MFDAYVVGDGRGGCDFGECGGLGVCFVGCWGGGGGGGGCEGAVSEVEDMAAGKKRINNES